MRPSEDVEGVYLSLVDANNRALNYLETKHGTKSHEVSEERGLFGQATSAVKATKRMWRHTGTLEIITRHSMDQGLEETLIRLPGDNRRKASIHICGS